MIIISRVDGKPTLAVFENFKSDRMLPKFRKPSEVAEQGESKQSGFSNVHVGNDEVGSESVFPSTNWLVNSDNSVNGVDGKRMPNWRRRIVTAVERVLGISHPRPREFHGNGNPLEILLSVRVSLQEVKAYFDRIKLYDETIRQAVKGSQYARANKLMKARQVVMQESTLIVSGFKQYLTEQAVIEFATKCKKGLRLDWVENFGRPIPPAVLARKVAADALKIFDNYVVLHYDPKAEAFQLTPAQVAAKKDPILFGVIDDVRKLYFIGEWKDDECDLTMDEVAKVLGCASSEINEDPTVE